MTSMTVTAPTRFDELRVTGCCKNYKNQLRKYDVWEREKNTTEAKTFGPWRDRGRDYEIINDCFRIPFHTSLNLVRILWECARCSIIYFLSIPYKDSRGQLAAAVTSNWTCRLTQLPQILQCCLCSLDFFRPISFVTISVVSI